MSPTAVVETDSKEKKKAVNNNIGKRAKKGSAIKRKQVNSTSNSKSKKLKNIDMEGEYDNIGHLVEENVSWNCVKIRRHGLKHVNRFLPLPPMMSLVMIVLKIWSLKILHQILLVRLVSIWLKKLGTKRKIVF